MKLQPQNYFQEQLSSLFPNISYLACLFPYQIRCSKARISSNEKRSLNFQFLVKHDPPLAYSTAASD